MAIDPIYLRLADVPDFTAAGGVERLSAEQRDRLAAVRQSAHVDYDAVREVKEAALRIAFARFEHGRGRVHAARAAEFASFVAARGRVARRLRPVPCPARSLRLAAVVGVARRPERAPAIGARGRPAQPEARDPLPRLPAVARRRRSGRRRGRRRASGSSATCRSSSAPTAPTCGSTRTSSTASCRVGTPPDAFSAEGQDWGLPAYRWDVVERQDFAWLRARARRGTELFDGYRVDHVIGFYRTYVRDAAGVGRFTPRGSGGAEGAGPERSCRSSRLRGRHPRRGSGHRPRLPPPVAAGAGRARLQGVPLGARTGRRTDIRSSIRGTTPRCRSRPPARTTPRALPSGGTPRRTTSASRR